MNQGFIFLLFLNLIIVESSLFIIFIQLFLKKISAVWKTRILKIQLFYLTLPLFIFLIIQISQWTFTEAKNVDMPDFYMIISVTNFYLGFQRQFPIEQIRIFFVIWIIGMILMLTCYLIKAKRMNHVLALCSKKNEKAEEMMMKICDELGIKHAPKIKVSPVLPVSCLIGILHPVIYLTHYSDSKQENEAMIKHELYHYKNRDHWTKFLAQLYCCLCWFNPLVYFVKGLLEENLELAVDERITENLSDDEVNFYCSLLIQCAEYAAKFNELTLGISFVKNRKNRIKRRLEHMLHYKKSKVKNLIASTIAGAMVLLTPINAAASSEVIKSYYEKKIFTGDLIEVSEVPVQEFTESTLDLTKYKNDGTFSLVRGNNQISESIHAKSSKQCLSLYLYKGDIINVSLVGSSSSASFSLLIGTKQVTSSNGSLNSVYTIPSDGRYTFVIVNESNNQINVMGFIDIN